MKNEIGGNILRSLLQRLLEMLFPLIAGMYIARVLEPAGVGQAAAARNLVSWFTMLAALGIPAYGVREMVCCPETEKDRLFSELMLLNFGATLGALILYLLLFGRRELAGIFALELLFHFFSVEWLHQSREDYGYIALRSLVTRALALLVMVLAVRTPADVPVYCLVLCLTNGIGALWDLVRAGRHVRFHFRKLQPLRHLKPVLTLAVSSLAASLYSRLDITMLGWLADPAQVGFYVNAHKTVSLALAVTASVTAVFLPRLSRAYRRQQSEFSMHLSAGLELQLLLSAPGCVGLMLVAEEMTEVLFGPAFAPAAETVRILALLIPIKGIGDLLCYQALVSAGKERYFPCARLAAGVGNLMLNTLLIPVWGHNGAAAASVFCELLGNGLLLIPCLGLCRPAPGKGILRVAAVSTGVMAAVVWLLRLRTAQPGPRLLLSVSMGMLSYGIMLWLQRKTISGGKLCTILRQKETK